MKTFYPPEIEFQMRRFFEQLPEQARRQYAVLETNKLGHGGVSYISGLLDIGRKTIYKGRNARVYFDEALPAGRQRRAGGDRKKNVRC